MPSKLTFHIIGFDQRVYDYLQQMQPSLVKIYEFPSEANIDEIRRRCPNTYIVYRQYTNLNFTDSADAFVAELDDALNKLSGRGIIWEGLNEPVLNSEQDARALCDWYVRFAELMHARGERVAAFSFSTGNPPLEYVPLLVPAAVACDYLALHEYYSPSIGAADLTRYRAFRARLPRAARKPILITECGVDDGRNNGWQSYLSPDAYLALLADYDRQLLQDAYVIGATIFQYGGGAPWQSFDVSMLGEQIARYVAEQGGGARGDGQESLAFPTFIFGVHDVGGQFPLINAQRSGWIVDSVDLSYQTAGDYAALVQAGIEPIVRLNNGYDTAGTIPPSSEYDRFAAQCARYVENSPDARIWIIGNEMNMSAARPELPDGTREVITPDKYVTCFLKCRAAIKSVPGHADDWVIPGAVAPYNNETVYPGNPLGDWVQYLIDILESLGDQVDALALHCYTHDYRVEQITSDAVMQPPFDNRHYDFRAYRDFLNALPERFRSLPVLITETNPVAGWNDTNIGWIQAAYREIAEWNAVTSHQPIQALVLFRWKTLPDHPEWGLEDKPRLLDDLRAALAQDYRVRWYARHPLAIKSVTFSPTTLRAGDLLNVSITVKNESAETLQTQGPDPGFVYDEGDTFRSRGYTETRGVFRVGIDFDERTGIDHPYRWGLGAPLAPGETRTITGAIRLKTPRTINYWAGAVHELVAWLADHEGKQAITVNPAGTVRIVDVTFSPTTLRAGELLNVSITVTNESAETLQTQGPDPGFVYDEGDTFRSRGYTETPGVFRVGIDFDERTGIDHPYRWGLGAPLAPGETRTITGAIRLKTPRTINYWAGLVHELVAWLADHEGKQPITVNPAGTVRIVDVAFSPTTLRAGELLNVSITVTNESAETLQTQGPDPGFVYDEGDTFRSRGYTETPGVFRVGIDFDERTGIDHPYRWGLGAPLAPGETRTITGAIRLKTPRTINYWAGLVHELVAWLSDSQGKQLITVVSAPVVSFTATPATIYAGQSATLEWNVTDARQVWLDGEPVSAQGTRVVTPTETTTYTLHVVFLDDSTRDLTATVTVSTRVQPTRPPTVTLTPENIALLKTYPRPANDNGRGLHFNIDLRDATIQSTIAHLLSINCKWTLIYAQDELQAKRAAAACWQAGIMPVVRIGKRVDQAFDPVVYVNALKSVGVPPYIQIYNEPGDDREWNKWPGHNNWIGIFATRWAEKAALVADAGGYPGLQILGREEFDAVVDAVANIGRTDIWRRAFFALHNYGANHPPDYPYDPINQAMYPGQTIFGDDVSVLVFLEYAAWMKERIGFVLPIIGGEGGWEFGAEQDRRYPKVEQPYHAQYHAAMFDWFRTNVIANGEPLPDYLFSITPWIEGGWGADDWWGGTLGDKTETIEAVRAIPPFVRKFSWDEEFPPAPIYSFVVKPTTIVAGESATLEWTVTGASQIWLDGTSVAFTGTQTVSPTQTTTYVLHIVFPDGSTKDLSATLTVTEPPVIPPLDWDPRLSALGVRLTNTDAPHAWRLISAIYQNEFESGGTHHVYYKALYADGTPAAGVRFLLDWNGRDPADDPVYATTDSNGETNIPLWAVMHPELQDGPYFTLAADQPSDKVSGMGLPANRHVNFILTFMYV